MSRRRQKNGAVRPGTSSSFCATEVWNQSVVGSCRKREAVDLGGIDYSRGVPTFSTVMIGARGEIGFSLPESPSEERCRRKSRKR